MRVSSAAEKSEQIKTHQRSFYTRIQRNMECHSWAPWTKSGSQNGVIRIKFWHLVVKTTQTPYKRLITKQTHSHITGQNRLQTLGAPTRSALGSTSISSPSWLYERWPSHHRA
ncbi:hypothetical protein M9H77_31367 [Catharanthus roseus]|uniref:Uncharacterized protein n=1 Tax=Catharanthus roseus TaxID=4058 RepID=A0ACC0A0X8_CATRO|nr:hypothetical protein M9H77_31367 [Catharanthus roseus]